MRHPVFSVSWHPSAWRGLRPPGVSHPGLFWAHPLLLLPGTCSLVTALTGVSRGDHLDRCQPGLVPPLLSGARLAFHPPRADCQVSSGACPRQPPAATLRPPPSTSRRGQLWAHPPWAPHTGAPPIQAHDLRCPLNTVRSQIPRHREAFLQPHPRPKLDMLPLAKAAATSSCVLPGERVLPTGPWEPGGRKLPPMSSLLRPGPRTKPDAQQRLTIYLPNRAGAPDTRCVGLRGTPVGLGRTRGASEGRGGILAAGRPETLPRGRMEKGGPENLGAGEQGHEPDKGQHPRVSADLQGRPAGAPDPLSTSGNSVTFEGDRKNRSFLAT